jgi:hypothetical protein
MSWKEILFWVALILLMFVITAKASTIGSFKSQNYIEILQQTEIEASFNYSFKEINSTHWNASFSIPLTTNFNPLTYVITNLTPNIGFATGVNKIIYNPRTGQGWFYLIFPKGFIANEMAQFGNSTTIINTGTTVPFYPNQRAICRDGLNYIHVAYLYSSTVIGYANSTDNGATFTVSYTKANTSGTKNTPSISCNGNNVTIAYVNGTATLAVFTSTNNGGTFADISPVTATTGKTVYEVDVERRGANIYLVYGNASTSTTKPSIIFLNSTTGGSTWGAKKVLMVGSYLRVGPLTTFNEYLHPSIAVNGTGGAIDIIHVLFQNDGIDNDGSAYFDIQYINSSNSGATWSSSPLSLMAVASNQPSYPSITFSDINLYGSFHRADNFVYFANSTNNGASWITAYKISVGTSANTYASISLNTTNPIVFWINGTANIQNLQYRSYSGSAWNDIQNITTDFRNNTYVNSKVDYSGSCTEYIWRNSTDGTTWNISYGAFGTCTAPATGTCSLSLNPSTLNYQSMNHDTTSVQDLNFTVVTNTGSTATNVLINGTVWANGGVTFVVGSTKYYNASGQTYANKIALTATATEIYHALAGSGTFNTYLDLQIPNGQTAGTYTQTVQLTSSC